MPVLIQWSLQFKILFSVVHFDDCINAFLISVDIDSF